MQQMPMIDVDIRQAIDRCSNIWASLPGALVMVSSSIKATNWSKIQESGRNRLKIDMSRVTAIISRSGHLHHRLYHGLLVTRDNAITYKAQRDKNAENCEAGERGNY